MARQIWNFTPELPLKSSPYWDWPIKPILILKYLLCSWTPLATRFLFLAVAILIWNFATPEFDRIRAGGFGWMVEIWLRNLAIILIFAGGFHLLLHRLAVQGDTEKYDARPMAVGSKKFHFRNQVLDNMFWSLGTGVLIWTFWECLMLWGFAQGYLRMITFSDAPIWFAAFVLLIPLWAGLYFYWQHRLFHIGPLYKHVHSWHHKNINIGPWSGLAMHPVEQFVLMSDLVILLLLPSHPIHGLFLLLHHGIGAPLSHSGFENLRIAKRLKYFIGDFHHALHHRFFDCNYGSLDMPWDEMFGTFHDGTDAGNVAMNERRRRLSDARG